MPGSCIFFTVNDKAIIGNVILEKLFLQILQYSQENTCVELSF